MGGELLVLVLVLNDFIVAKDKQNHKRIRPKSHKVLIWGLFHGVFSLDYYYHWS
jgi:hypothetical protein